MILWSIRSDSYYILRGERLIRQRRILNDLIRDVETDNLSAQDVVDRLKAARDCIPADPPRAY